MGPLYLEFLKNSSEFNIQVCITAQHRQMLDQVLEIFSIDVDFDLDAMKEAQTLNLLTSTLLSRLDDLLAKLNPDLILVHGDTTTALSAALAAFHRNLRIGHVEAGLRTYNMDSPFPEEMNRSVISKLASLNFCPTNQSKLNLIAEGVSPEKIIVTGNTVIDALFVTLNKIATNTDISKKINNKISTNLNFDWHKGNYVLITGHRRENFGEAFERICESLRTLSSNFPNFHFVYPVHLNPNVHIPVNKMLSGIENIHLLEPQDYLTFSQLLKNCYLVLTDSGGIQEEAPSLGKPVLVMRDNTERPEGLEAGTVRLVGTDKNSIVKNVSELIENSTLYSQMCEAQNPYGDGRASFRIVEAISLALTD